MAMTDGGATGGWRQRLKEDDEKEGHAWKLAKCMRPNNEENPDGVIVLGLYMHCDGCAETVVKHLRGFYGVEQIETDRKNHRVTVKGKKAEPRKVMERLRKKGHYHVTLISPVLVEKKEVKKEEKKEEARAPKVVEVVLKIFLHCEACVEDIKRCIHRMQGVYSVEAEMEKSRVTVKGEIEAKKLAEYVKRKAGKHAEIVMVLPEKEDEEDAKRKQEGENKIDLEGLYRIYPPGLVYAPQLFSEENPNACCAM
ncbi:heavy metal-associated isoprenylated plant protein 7-like [Diospyros lotus]|uniref:heavy metal-associated isoprenylated plant protein 7-like n=1 Tax=Diospyros lotus TaxID=55363 RepID=UPI0022540901|nr:heavy metal-associated isoprenylated plant protein 7-like [Diospyros lotus]